MTTMARWMLGAAILLAGLACAVALLFAFALEDRAAFAPPERPSPSLLGEMTRTVRAAMLPMLAGGAGTHAELVMPAAALQVLGADVVKRSINVAGARVRIDSVGVEVGVSAPLSRWLSLPVPKGDAWLNLRARFEEQPGGLPRLVSLGCGRLQVPVPVFLQRWLFDQVAVQRPLLKRAHSLSKMVESVSFEPDTVKLTLRNPKAMLQRLSGQTLSEPEMRSVQRYRGDIATALSAADLAGGATVPVSRLLVPLMTSAAHLAKEPAGTEPRRLYARAQPGALSGEFRIALLTLSLYALNVEAAAWGPETLGINLPRRELSLRGRQDHALHFLISAWLAMDAGGAWADLLGLYKELSDAGSVRGSGFSFDDLAADRAGMALGQRAVREPEELVELLPRLTNDAAWMPSTSDLPTGLASADFTARFGRVGSPTYERVLNQIDRRVQALVMMQTAAP